MCLSYYKIAHPFQQVSIRSFCRPLFERQQRVYLPPVQRCAAGGEKRPVRGAKSGRLRRPGEPVFTGENAAARRRGQKGDRTRMVSYPPLNSPSSSFRDAQRSCASKRGLRRLGSGRRADFGTHGRPEFTLRGLPRITVRGQTVQGGGVPLRKVPLQSSAVSWSTRRPCGSPRI